MQPSTQGLPVFTARAEELNKKNTERVLVYVFIACTAVYTVTVISAEDTRDMH